ncbi:MAG: methylenetetrahydrofolate reductase [Methanosarcinales archaeon]|nr:methylenetetrahydrofolate reductase [ANME-2 cluster archaeon]MDF1532183.1 methylenetetrahydrofolate reductase [ANME-2 cluster archaeon]MDW7776826.1 methylenetetrahydrofolate reductase [Methanosarcinales archaeon]
MGFADVLDSGKFIITAEVSPPRGTDLSGVLAESHHLQGLVDAVNVTDNQRAMMRMSPMVLCHKLEEAGFTTIMHITCRDRNRLALQSDLLAAHALGIRNVLAMSGDYPTMGDQPSAKPVFDLDSVQLLQMIEKMNNGFDFQDEPIDGPTSLCAGAVANPGARPLALQLLKLNKKVSAKARFIQTQAVFDAEVFHEFADVMKSTGIPLIAGIIPLKSARSARFMNEKIPGVTIPEDDMRRMEAASDPVSEGLEIAAETIARIRQHCRGIHIMPIGGQGNTRRLLEMCGLD